MGNLQQRAAVVLLILFIIVSGGTLWAETAQVHDFKASQQRQGQILDQKLCTTFSKLAALKPPAGNPATNPSRAYDQELHATIDQLGTDLGCR